MPRKWLEPVEAFPALRVSGLHRLRIVDVEKAPKAIRATLEHLDAEQRDRTHTVLLPLPIRPEGLSAQFFRAAGVEVAAGRKLAPKDVLGATVGVRFRSSGSGNYEVVAFEAIHKEVPDDEQVA